ncbi:MAG: hypothetical protein ACR2K9_04255 [Solirubrobacteraceae bacterium]
MKALRRLMGVEGQASLEVVALAPVLAVVALGLLQLLAAGAAAEFADHAAEAAGVAIIQGAQPGRAARDAVPGWARSGLRVSVRAGQVRVSVRPPSPLRALGCLLTATSEADVRR